MYFIRWILLMQFGQYMLNYMVMQNTVLPLYIAFLARSGCHPTVRTYLNGVRVFYEMRGHPSPLAGSFGLTHLQKGLKRTRPGGSKRKLPITLALLHVLVSTCNLDTPAGAAIACAAVIAFFAFLRKSNVTTGRSRSTSEFKNTLTAGNVWVDYPTYTLWIRLTCTKTIQFGERVLEIPIPGRQGSPIDPVALWENHLRQSTLPRQASQPAFAYQQSQGGAWTYLSHSTFVAAVKTAAKSAGLDSARYAAHSFRRGGATFAASCGASPDLIKAMGDWSSDAYQLYLCMQVQTRQHAAHLMATAAHGF